MKNKNQNYIGWITLAVLIVVVGLVVMFVLRPRQVAAELDGFAQCLASKKITMYGAEWCPHCQNEKAAFGASFKFVPYVECPNDIQKCLDLGINGYPTWIFGDGKKYEGEQGINKLSELSGCPLPVPAQ